jgi:hypothetical protein
MEEEEEDSQFYRKVDKSKTALTHFLCFPDFVQENGISWFVENASKYIS